MNSTEKEEKVEGETEQRGKFFPRNIDRDCSLFIGNDIPNEVNGKESTVNRSLGGSTYPS